MENKKGLSIAVMLSVVGLLGLGFGTCMGMLLDGKSMAAALIFAATVVVGGALGLFLAVKAKTVDNEFTKWKKYEFVGLAICVAVIVFAAQPTIYTGNFIFGNSNLRQAGNDDISLVRAMITRFKAQESDRLSLTREGLENYIAFRPSNVSRGLSQYIRFDVMHGQAGVLNRYILNDYTAEKSFLIEHGSLQEDVFGKYENELNRISSLLSGFDFAKFSTMASTLTALSDSVGANLTALSRNFNFGNITVDHYGQYSITPSESYNYSDRALNFGNEYAAMFSPRASSLSLFLVFALLFILDYLLEFRSLRVPAGSGPKISDKDGIPL